jgi:hypothetical protein
MGARQVDIRNQFVMKAFAVTVTGGLLGIAMGLAIAKGVAAYAGWKTIVTFWSIALSVGVSAAVGLVFGSYPAMRAARLDPWKRYATSSPVTPRGLQPSPGWRRVMEQVIEVEASSLEDARKEAASKVPAGYHLWSEDVLADGAPKSVTASAATEEAALAAAAAQVPPGAQATGNTIRTPPGRRVAETAAWSEASARRQVEGQIDETAKVEAVRLKTPGKTGFLGLGRKPAVYEVEIAQDAVAVARYESPARIRIHVGDRRVPDSGFCQMCGQRGGRVKVSKHKATYYCSTACESSYNRASIRAAMAGAFIVGVTRQQYDAIQEAAASDRVFCWSCGVSMDMSKRACPSCGKDQNPVA